VVAFGGVRSQPDLASTARARSGKRV